MKIVRTIDELAFAATGSASCRRWARCTTGTGRSSVRRGPKTMSSSRRLFVNAAQFGDAADLEAYPRDEERDAEIAREEGVDVLFAPSADEMYPVGFATWVDVDGTGAEGDARPGHFRAVATVCLKLFNIVRPERAYFGQKDAQQAAVIRRVVRDLNVGVRDPRAADGARRRRAGALVEKRAAFDGRARASTRSPPRACRGRRGVHTRRGRSPRQPQFLQRPATRSTSSSWSSTAPRFLPPPLRVGDTRLIDNVLLKGELS